MEVGTAFEAAWSKVPHTEETCDIILSQLGRWRIQVKQTRIAEIQAQITQYTIRCSEEWLQSMLDGSTIELTPGTGQGSANLKVTLEPYYPKLTFRLNLKTMDLNVTFVKPRDPCIRLPWKPKHFNKLVGMPIACLDDVNFTALLERSGISLPTEGPEKCGPKGKLFHYGTDPIVWKQLHDQLKRELERVDIKLVKRHISRKRKKS